MNTNNTVSIKRLTNYVKSNEVVYQEFGGLVEVSNDKESENKSRLINYLDNAATVEIYEKGHWFIKDDFCELDSWSTDNDVLFLLSPMGILVCTPKCDVIQHKLISA